MSCKKSKNRCPTKKNSCIEEDNKIFDQLIRFKPIKSSNPNLYFIMLRQPENDEDPRTDPEYNIGYFGRTGCHNHSIMHLDSVENRLKEGDRFAFLQGGYFEGGSTFKISFITPPIIERGKVHRINDNEWYGYIRWDSNWDVKENRPIKFEYQFNIIQEPGYDKFTEKEMSFIKLMNSNFNPAKQTKKVKGKKYDRTKADRFMSYFRTMYKKYNYSLNSKEVKDILAYYEKNITSMKNKNSPENVFIEDNSQAIF